jgi:hypothetical protein
MKKEIIHIGNDNKCETCFNLGYNKALEDVDKIINDLQLTSLTYDNIDIFLRHLQNLKEKK